MSEFIDKNQRAINLLWRMHAETALADFRLEALDDLVARGWCPSYRVPRAQSAPGEPDYLDSLLVQAVQHCNLPAIGWLLDHGEDPDFIGATRRTPLSHWAAMEIDRFEVQNVEHWRQMGLVLLRHGASPHKAWPGVPSAIDQARLGSSDALALIQPFHQRASLDASTPKAASDAPPARL